MSDWQEEFTDFPAADMPPRLPGFVDTSWRNDACPSFADESLGLSVWIDYADPSRREHPEIERFSISEIDDSGAHIGEEPALTTDDWAKVLDFIAARARP
jgi:hypothetical protein